MNAARTIILALLLGWVFPAVADVAVPSLVGRVVDLTGTLSTNDVSAMNQTIRAFEARKGSQVAVLIVPTTDGEAIEQFSLRVAEAWKIGRKKIDDGVLLVIAKNDRKLRIEVGYGLEGALTDVTSKRIIDEIITPHFRAAILPAAFPPASIVSSALSRARNCLRRCRPGRPEACNSPGCWTTSIR